MRWSRRIPVGMLVRLEHWTDGKKAYRDQTLGIYLGPSTRVRRDSRVEAQALILMSGFSQVREYDYGLIQEVVR